jgi:exodeoxyribonuclease V alpha subunit
MTTLEGTVERVVFANEENSWTVAKISRRDSAGPLTAVGNLVGVRPGETVRLSGRWVTSRKFGKQFQVESYLPIEPSTIEGIRKYLGSGLVSGIGKGMAHRIVKHFGTSTLQTLDQSPDRLQEVPGIGPLRAAKIQAAWKAGRELKAVAVFLQSHGLSASHAIKVFRHFGTSAIPRIREDPYQLAAVISGIGFLTADRIAADLGVPPNSQRRLTAGLFHILDQAAENGHVFLPRTLLLERAAQLLEAESAALEPALEEQLKSKHLVSPKQHFGKDSAIYQSALFLAERGIARRIRALKNIRPRLEKIDVDRAIKWFETREQFHLASQQHSALEMALREKLLIITGGPGTGKTTLMRAVVQILSAKGVRVALAAPTGRAASRLSQTTSAEAKTLHRLLEFDPATGRFQRDSRRPVSADLLIVDEASMLDSRLAHALLQAVRPDSRLLLVGDIDQLPSVGPGSVLSSLIESEEVPCVRLDQVFRQAS